MLNNRFMPKNLEADEKTNKVLLQIEKGFGMIPNMFKIAAQDPSVLEEFLRWASVMKGGSLTLLEHEAVSLLVSEINNCYYCLSAHTMIGKAAGFTDEEMLEIRKGKHSNEKLDALLKLTAEAVENKYGVSESTLDKFYSVGYGNKELIEVIGIITEKTFTNLLGRITKPELDFQPAPILEEEKLQQ